MQSKGGAELGRCRAGEVQSWGGAELGGGGRSIGLLTSLLTALPVPALPAPTQYLTFAHTQTPVSCPPAACCPLGRGSVADLLLLLPPCPPDPLLPIPFLSHGLLLLPHPPSPSCLPASPAPDTGHGYEPASHDLVFSSLEAAEGEGEGPGGGGKMLSWGAGEVQWW